MSSTETDRPTWNRKRAQKRKDLRAQRMSAHHQQLRREGAARGMRGVADAEWNVLRSVVAGVPEPVRDEEWKAIAAIVRQLSEVLAARHSK